MTDDSLNKDNDLGDFNHIKDTLTMLGITIAQIRTSLSDSNANVDTWAVPSHKLLTTF